MDKEAENLEYVVGSEDSGFASIAESYASSESGLSQPDESLTKIADNVKIVNEPFLVSEEQNNKPKRKRLNEAEQEVARLAAEKHEEEAKDQRYKRLMHLLNRSKFYSSYLLQKIDGSLKPEPNKLGINRKTNMNKENSPPKRKTRKPGKDIQNYDIKDYVSLTDMQKKADQRQLNLSQEEIADELMSDNQSQVKNKSSNVYQSMNLKYFRGELRDYQVEGLKWLQILYENGVNGILADEMGLGKTIQVIALICYLIEKKIPGPYLVVAPLSTIPNWLMEFERFAPKLPVVLLYGPAPNRQVTYPKIKTKFFEIDGYRTAPVVLTTYDVTLMEARFLHSQRWRYIVVDEAQRIKNYKCQLIQVLKNCQSMNRLLLTGTPLQNDLSELWSLLNFLLPEIFNDLAVFESWFNATELQNDEGTQRVLKQEAEKHVLLSLREILKPFMLRRVKSDVCLDIPPKKEMVVYAPLTELQHNLYRAVLSRDIAVLSKIQKEELIIPDVDGQRPKRRCRLRKELSTYKFSEDNSLSSSDASMYIDDEDSSTWKHNNSADAKSLSLWKQYINIDDRNREYFLRLTLQNRGAMYKKIVNHPYLVHCPLNDGGLPKIDEDLVKSSGKLLVLDAMLDKLKARGHKVLLFSTWTMILDMIEDYLQLRDYAYERLDGTDKIEDRQRSIQSFNSDPEIFLFLISTRAGGVGLNLTAADTVIMYDSDWNPQVDIQAMARCHRIGQTRPVLIYKFCTKGTIDERIISRAQAKRKLEKMVISEDVIKLNINSVDTLLELQKLLESSECHVVTSESDVFTHKELDDILDRSDLMPKPKVCSSMHQTSSPKRTKRK